MARTPTLFNGPVEFMDTGTGKQIQLPLSSVFFEDNKPKAEGCACWR